MRTFEKILKSRLRGILNEASLNDILGGDSEGEEEIGNLTDDPNSAIPSEEELEDEDEKEEKEDTTIPSAVVEYVKIAKRALMFDPDNIDSAVKIKLISTDIDSDNALNILQQISDIADQ